MDIYLCSTNNCIISKINIFISIYLGLWILNLLIELVERLF